MVEEQTRPQETKKKRREKESRRVRSISPMSMVVPYVMVNRCGAQNMLHDTFDIENIEKYIREKQAAGMTNISMMHVLIAAYVRLVSQRPALNRFIRGQRIWTRKHVEVALTIKKEMLLDSPDTVVKITLDPAATTEDVYRELNKVVTEYRNNPGGDFDKTAKVFSYLPGLLFKFAVWFLKLLDYFHLMPRILEKVSPFHCSYFITSMGSLGIPPIFHHLYDFGTCPAFFAFGAKRRVYELDAEGVVRKRHFIDVSFVLDERICDGYYYASALRLMKNIIRNPWQLDEIPTVVPDVE